MRAAGGLCAETRVPALGGKCADAPAAQGVSKAQGGAGASDHAGTALKAAARTRCMQQAARDGESVTQRQERAVILGERVRRPSRELAFVVVAGVVVVAPLVRSRRMPRVRFGRGVLSTNESRLGDESRCSDGAVAREATLDDAR